jgi:hypothetical protein
VKPPLADGRYKLTIPAKPNLPSYPVRRVNGEWLPAKTMKHHPTLTDEQVDEEVGREMGLVAKAVNRGGHSTSADVVAWAKVHPDSMLYWMIDWSPGLTDEQRIALFDKAAAEGTDPIRL